jgi:hypothetical protein
MRALRGHGFKDAFMQDLAMLFLEIRSNPYLLVKIFMKIYLNPTSQYMVMIGDRDYLDIKNFKEAIV